MPLATAGSSDASPATVSAARGSQVRSSPDPAALNWYRTASSIAVIRSRSASSMLVLPPPVIAYTPIALPPSLSHKTSSIGSPVSGTAPIGTGLRMLARPGNQSV
jgi:hypothetical protein